MNILANLGGVHYLAVLVATVAAFAIGALWYSPLLFSNTWMKVVGMTKADTEKNMMQPMIIGFVMIFVGGIILALFAGGAGTMQGAETGLLMGLLVSTNIIMSAMYENRSWTYVGISAGYALVLLIVMGGIIGGW